VIFSLLQVKPFNSNKNMLTLGTFTA